MAIFDKTIVMRYFYFIWFLFLLLALPHCKTSQKTVQESEEINQQIRIAFGSCNKEDEDQAYWQNIGALDPDIWLWMGDNIYADSGDPEIIGEAYSTQLNNAYYKDFISSVQVYGTWDDHDYGMNDGNESYKHKKESKNLMMKFLGLEEDSSLNSHPGVYYSRLVFNDRVKLIFLDTRSFQDILSYNPDRTSRYLPSSDGDILGEEQWSWLHYELEKSPAQINIIVSSIQFIAEEQKYEKWDNFPKSKAMLESILTSHPDKPCMILSGDRHIAEVSRKELPGLPYPLYDITSSGLTHSYQSAEESNSYRISDLITTRNFGLLDIKSSEEDLAIDVTIYSTDGDVLLKHTMDLE